MWVTAMRTTFELPDDILRRAKSLAARDRGTERPRKRLSKPPIKLAADAPLRRMSPEAVRRVDAEDLVRSEQGKALALHR
jgi:hypothetical protein